MDLKIMLPFIAAIPLLWLLFSLGLLHYPALKASSIGLILVVLIAILVFNYPIISTTTAIIEGISLALWPISWVIIAAIFTYNVTSETGNITVIKTIFTKISDDRCIQVLLLAWAFSGFLEGATGYGTAVVIPASILVALGFEPFFAALICIIGNTAPTAFGSIGIPLITLAKVTNLETPILSRHVAMQLTPLIILLPLFMTWLTVGRKESLRGVILLSLISGISFAAVHYLTARYVGPELPSMLGGIITLLVIIVWLKLTKKNSSASVNEHNFEDQRLINNNEHPKQFRLGLIACSPYIILFILIIITIMIAPLNLFLSSIESHFKIGTNKISVQWILTPGSLMIISGLLGGLIQGASLNQMLKIFVKTLAQLWKTILTVCSIVGIAKVMSYSGMISQIALSLSTTAGVIYPFLAPAIGALGAFLTGSDTSSNILFGQLQKETALKLGLNPEWIAAANNSGATAGKLLSPQNIAIAAAVTGLGGSEGVLLAKAFKVFLFYLLILGLIIFFK